MLNWFNYYRKGMSHEMPTDRIVGEGKPKAPREAIKSLLPYLRAHWRFGLLGAVLIILTSLLSFPQPLINRFLVDDVILAKKMELLPWAILLLVGFKIISMGAGMVQQYTIQNFEQSVILDIQKALIEHTLRLPKTFFDKKEIGYIISRISSDVQGLNWFFSGTIIHLFTNLIQFMGGLAFLFYLEWRLALSCVIVLPILIIAVRFYSKRMHTLSYSGMEQYGMIIKRLQETIASVPLIKAFSSEKREGERVVDALEGGKQVAMEQNVVGSVAGTVINIMPDIVKAIVLIVGAYLAIKGEWTLGSLLAFQSYLGFVFGPALFLANANLSLQNSLASLERVMNLFNIVPEENLDSGIIVDHLKGEITFRDVNFSYGDNENVLNGIDLKIKAGEHVAIVGPSGVGKTTLVSLMLCFYKPSQGSIFFDGLPVSVYNLPSLRKRIGYVAQSSLLLSGTFSENLRYGNTDASQEQMELVTKAAGIHEFILSLPQGYEAKIDERGVNLSDGQKQRLSIARALLMNPDILILDEPTSALDSIVEHSIFKALPELVRGKTMIIVAHRLATIKDADRILLVNEKGLAGEGTHRSLLENSPFYRELVEKQQLSI